VTHPSESDGAAGGDGRRAAARRGDGAVWEGDDVAAVWDERRMPSANAILSVRDISACSADVADAAAGEAASSSQAATSARIAGELEVGDDGAEPEAEVDEFWLSRGLCE
jgi:hypothetical protein